MNRLKNIDQEKLFTATIWSYFSEVQDPRVDDNQKYKFRDLIVAIICGMICGANNVESIVNYVESEIDWFRTNLGLQQPPSYKTIWWLLVLIDPEELNKAFTRFVEDIRQALGGNQPEGLEHVAVEVLVQKGRMKYHFDKNFHEEVQNGFSST